MIITYDFQVWLNAKCVGAYVRKGTATRKANNLMNTGKYNSQDDDLYLLQVSTGQITNFL